MNEIIERNFLMSIADKDKEKRYSNWKGMNVFLAELQRRHAKG